MSKSTKKLEQSALNGLLIDDTEALFQQNLFLLKILIVS